MAATLHHRTTAQPSLKKVLVWSLVLHLAALAAMSLTLTTRVRLSTPAIQVKLVGVPQPASASKKVEPKKVRTQDSAAPKEPPKNMKNIPESQAKTKFVTEPKEAAPDKKEELVEASKRPPTLDKSDREKKVVKNDKDAKVVKNPEDFLESLDDFLENAKATPKPQQAKADPTKQAGEGPTLQLNASDDGVISALRQAVESNWTVPPGKDTDGLVVVVQIRLSPNGDLIGLHVVDSSGDQSFDDSLVRAIRKTVPLPIPADKIEKFRNAEFSFGR